MGRKTHELKCWPEYFMAIRTGIKKFELRKDDRDFKVGEQITLKEYDPRYCGYSGDSIVVWINYKFDDENLGLEPGYCILGITR